MGMFDSLYEGARQSYDTEWQTKAYSCNLDTYWVGDVLPPLGECVSYQVEILGGSRDSKSRESLATVVDGVLVDIDNERAWSLPLFGYSGHRVSSPVGDAS